MWKSNLQANVTLSAGTMSLNGENVLYLVRANGNSSEAEMIFFSLANPEVRKNFVCVTNSIVVH